MICLKRWALRREEIKMAMSKKNYEAIAKTLINSLPYSFRSSDEYFDLVSELCVIFSTDNDRFDADKFRQACIMMDSHASNN